MPGVMTGQPRHTALLNSHRSERDPHVAVVLLEDRRSESMAEPEIVNRELHGYLPDLGPDGVQRERRSDPAPSARNRPPDDPPVPLKPMVRCTVRR